jgi:predicted nucleic acid-binding protein
MKNLVYLDMNIYNRSFDDQSQWRIKMESIACQIIFYLAQRGEIKLVWSFVLEYENSLNPFPDRHDEVILLSKIAQHTIEPSEAILQRSEELEKAGIKNMDAVHLACAEIFDCDFFITCDDKLIKKANRLNVKLDICNPINFIEKVTENETT